jgi:hypothetical protein
MADLHDQLEEEEARFRLPPDALGRFHARRRQRQRNRRILSGAVAVSIAATGTWLAFSAIDGRQQPRPANATVVAKLAAEPRGIATGEGYIWVAASDSLFRIDPSSGAATRTRLPRRLGQPISAQVAEGSVWVQTASVGQEFPTSPGHPRRYPAAVVRIDPASGTVISTFDLPYNVVIPVSVGEGAIWSVTNSGLVTRREIDDVAVTTTVRAQASPVAISVGEGAVWILSRGEIDRIDPERVSVTAEVGVAVGGELAVGAGGVWILDEQESFIIQVDPDPASVVEVIQMTGTPDRLTAGADGLWVLDRSTGVVSRVDGGRVVEEAEVGRDAAELTQGDGSVWVARSDGSILRIQA